MPSSSSTLSRMLPLSYRFQFQTYIPKQHHSFPFFSPILEPISRPISISKPNPHHSHTAITQMATTTTDPQPDPISTRLQELKQFDDSKIGVKGLVDSGLTTIPSFFIHPNPPEPNPKSPNTKQDPDSRPDPELTIPIVDFSSPRSTIVEQVRWASSSLGFFQIINHSVPLSSINKILNSMKEFFDLPESTKTEYYRRDMTKGAAYSTNFDLYQSKAASWRDTYQMRLAPTPPDWDHVPVTCREAVTEWDKEVLKISEQIMEILCEGLGLEKSEKLKEMSCMDARVLVGHYYPHCPQPELTAGLTSHSDPGVLTVLVQNEVPGLQVKVGEHWVDVEPVEGAIVINIGDILQIMSNEEYKSVEHRVLANPYRDPRVSIAVFLNPGIRDQLYGPFAELVSAEKPALYRQVTFIDYMRRFFSKELDGKTLTNYYRV